jgi:uncharacterized protein with GYD domain
MGKYLFEASYTLDGVRGLVREGGTSRRAAVEKAIGGLGGSIEAFYYCFGDDDVVVIADAPDNVSAAAASLAIAASGAVSIKTTVLLTPEEIDAATKVTVGYRPPGG